MGSAPCVQGATWVSAAPKVIYDTKATEELENELKLCSIYGSIPNFDKMIRLVRGGANPCVKNKYGRTLWHYAAMFDRDDVILQLIQLLQLNPLIADYPGREMVTCLNSRDDIGRTPLHEAILSKSNEAVRILVLNGANLAAIDNFGRTTLHAAVISWNLFAVQLLLRTIATHRPECLNAYVNTPDRLGTSPLHDAVLSNNYEFVRILIANGADPAAKDGFGQFPSHMAVQR
ncbi:MAG: ankyrin repeat domain-containing protein [Puniceicoccales bacterium]|jgi:ankyrin repeat protein|nr:ankyrin repeat domain-containing protein [Puniceicoccales bacterium]